MTMSTYGHTALDFIYLITYRYIEELVLRMLSWFTDLRETNTRFCIFHVKTNHCQGHLMVSSRVVNSKNTQIGHLVCVFFSDKAKMAKVTREVFQTGSSWYVLMYRVRCRIVTFSPFNGNVPCILFLERCNRYNPGP